MTMIMAVVIAGVLSLAASPATHQTPSPEHTESARSHEQERQEEEEVERKKAEARCLRAYVQSYGEWPWPQDGESSRRVKSAIYWHEHCV